jgi:hypothetical protein
MVGRLFMYVSMGMEEKLDEMEIMESWITYNIRCEEVFLLQVGVKIKLHVRAFPQLHM